MDCCIKGGTLPDGRVADIGIAARRSPRSSRTLMPRRAGHRRAGCLVSPPFVDPHFHMDATLSYGIPRINRVRHAAGRHRAVGRTEAAADA
jgi:cytosine deaminase